VPTKSPVATRKSRAAWALHQREEDGSWARYGAQRLGARGVVQAAVGPDRWNRVIGRACTFRPGRAKVSSSLAWSVRCSAATRPQRWWRSRCARATPRATMGWASCSRMARPHPSAEQHRPVDSQADATPSETEARPREGADVRIRPAAETSGALTGVLSDVHPHSGQETACVESPAAGRGMLLASLGCVYRVPTPSRPWKLDQKATDFHPGGYRRQAGQAV